MNFVAGYILGAITTPVVAVAFIVLDAWIERRLQRKYTFVEDNRTDDTPDPPIRL